MSTSRVRSRWATRSPAVVAAVVAGLAALLIGGGLVLNRAPSWRASSSLLVLPDRAASPDAAAGLYDTLSRGQLVQTYASVANSPGFVGGALNGLKITVKQRRSLSIAVTPVPNTNLIDVSATADTAPLAEAAADAVSSQAVATLASTFYPFRVTEVSSARGTAMSAKTSSTTLLAVVLIASLVLAFAAFRGGMLWSRRRVANTRGTRPPRPSRHPPTPLTTGNGEPLSGSVRSSSP
jgi:capsular polysaccharide biosynthesis protein